LREHCVAHPSGTEQEDAGVPAIAARREHRLCIGERRLFDEAVDHEAVVAEGRAVGDIAEAGFGAGGGDAEGDDPVLLRQPRAAGNRGVEGGNVCDNMVAGHHQQQRIGGDARDCERDGRGGVARHRLDEQRCMARAQLITHRGDMGVAAQDDRGTETGARGRAHDRLLEQALRPCKR